MEIKNIISSKKIWILPDDLESLDMCMKVIQEDIWAFHSVPSRFKTSELCEIALKKNGVLLEYVPLEKKTEKLCQIAVEQNGWALHFVPEILRTKKICTAAVTSHGWALHDVPEHLKSLDLCRIALDNDPGARKFVPKEILKQYLNTDIDNLQSLKKYIRFTYKKFQNPRYIEAFFEKASIEEIEKMAPYISLKLIPKKSIPLLKDSKSLLLKNYANRKMPKRLLSYLFP